MKYHGKNYLYGFLKEHGYAVPKRKEMEYEFYHGSEWLRGYLLEAYSPMRDVIYVTVKEECEEREVQVEYSKYVNGLLEYQENRGGITVMYAKEYKPQEIKNERL